jgi:hypothetical protein
MESPRIELEERRLLLETKSHQQQASLSKTLEGIESAMAFFATCQYQQIKLLENQKEALSQQGDTLLALVTHLNNRSNDS